MWTAVVIIVVLVVVVFSASKAFVKHEILPKDKDDKHDH